MNANSVWVGHEYAYVDFVRRNHIPMTAIRTKVLSKRETQAYGKTRKDTFALVEFMDSDRPNREVNVRNLYDFWDSYSDERQAVQAKREAQRLEREARWAADEAERARQRALRDKELEAKKARLERIRQGLAVQLAIDPSVIQTDSTQEWLKIPARDLAFLDHA